MKRVRLQEFEEVVCSMGRITEKLRKLRYKFIHEFEDSPEYDLSSVSEYTVDTKLQEINNVLDDLIEDIDQHVSQKVDISFYQDPSWVDRAHT